MSKWKFVKLGEVATYINGYAFKPIDWSDEGLPIIRIQDLTGNSYETNYYSGDYDIKYEINDGDILISWSASLGVYKWNRGKALLNQHIFKVVFDKLNVDKSYYAYTVEYLINDMAKETHGSTMKHITKPRFDNTPFPYPPITEQRRIAETLEKVDRIIVICNNMLIKYNLLVKSQFVEMFGNYKSNSNNFKVDILEKHIDVLSGYPFESTRYVENGINICGGLIIMPQVINWKECKHWRTSEGYEVYLLENNDIVMALDRPWISEGFKIAKVDEEHLPALLIQRTARIRATDIIQEYLYHCFLYCGFDEHCNITGSLVPHISVKDIKSFSIMIPPLDLQNQFADFVQQVDKSKLAVKKTLEKAETLKKALMQEYFG